MIGRLGPKVPRAPIDQYFGDFLGRFMINDRGSTPGGRTIPEVLMDGGKTIGQPGRSPGVRTVADAPELQALFDELSAGGTRLPPGTYPGVRVQMPDGSQIGLRTTSKSGGPTIDIKGPNGDTLKVHIK